MSEIHRFSKKILRKYITKGRLLELFPGDNGDNDSILFFHELLGNKITAIGNNDYESQFVKYYNQSVPPYPSFILKFDYIFLREAEWLIMPEYGSPVDFSKFPKAGIRFIHSNLKKNGIFFITNVHKVIAERVNTWLNHFGKYDFEFYEPSRRSEVAIYTKK